MVGRMTGGAGQLARGRQCGFREQIPAEVSQGQSPAMGFCSGEAAGGRGDIFLRPVRDGPGERRRRSKRRRRRRPSPTGPEGAACRSSSPRKPCCHYAVKGVRGNDVGARAGAQPCAGRPQQSPSGRRTKRWTGGNWRRATAFAALTLTLRPSLAADNALADLNGIQNIVVIYAENRSFDIFSARSPVPTAWRMPATPASSSSIATARC